MSRALPTSDRETWLRTLSFLLLGSICYALPWSVFAALPIPTDNSSVLRIQGSNTIGARLGPALVAGLLEEQGLSAIRIETGMAENEQKIVATSADGRRLSIEVAAHGSGTGFSALADGSAELAASSRPIKHSEASSLAAQGDLTSREAEQIIALDGLAIILHPSNPLTALSTEQLAQVFAGELSDWAQLGAPPGPISLYARDDKSGTFDTFKELVLTFPSETYISEQLDTVDPQRVHAVRESWRRGMAAALHADWVWAYESHQVREALLPNSKPLADGFVGSGFGWRSDPFTGRMARHEGMDFAAPPGTPIHAAAGGVGLIAGQWMRALGVKPVGTAASGSLVSIRITSTPPCTPPASRPRSTTCSARSPPSSSATRSVSPSSGWRRPSSS